MRCHGGRLERRQVFGEGFHLRVGEPSGDLTHHAAGIVVGMVGTATVTTKQLSEELGD